MGKNKRILVLLLFLIIAGSVFAQTNRYVVHFTDKDGSSYSIDRPEEFLSQKAIDRRLKYDISITIEDIPVNKEYITGVKEKEAEVFFQSRWFNAVLIQADKSIVDSVASLAYVDTVEYVAPGDKLSSRVSYTKKDMGTTEVAETMISNAVQNEMMGVDHMHEEGFTGKDIMVAVFDAGFNSVDENIYFQHLYENSRVVATMDYLTNSENVYKYDDHGTNVLSCIVAYKEGDYEAAAYNVDVILCITEDATPEHRIEEYNWLFAAEMADSAGTDIINTSLGYSTFDDPSMNYTYEDMDGNTTVITRATNIATSKGILCVVSIGNEGDKEWKYLVAPADAESILAVGAVTSNYETVSFSSFGPTADGRMKPEVSALGLGVSVVGPANTIRNGNGTSFAAPLVSAFAAGLWEAYPELSNTELIELIINGSSHYENPDNIIGYGVPDFAKIYSMITAFEDNLPGKRFRVYPNPVKSEVVFIESTHGRFKHDLDVQLYNLNGQLIVAKTFDKSKRDKRIEMDLSNIPSGVYLLYIRENDINEAIKLIIP